MESVWKEFKAVRKEGISVAVCVVFALYFLLYPDQAITLVAGITQYAVKQFGLAFILVSSGFVIIALALALSPWGSIKLGQPDDTPEFGFFSWIAMLFAAGMGSGLIFWGVAEPLFHYSNPPAFAAQAESPKDMALALTYFHWGIHAWSIYAVAALAMAWFAFNRGRSMSVSASFTEEQKFTPFQLFDFLAVVAVVFGVAGTLGNTIALVQTGVEHVSGGEGADGFGVEGRMALLAFITVAFSISSILGLNRGIKHLSQFNLLFVGFLLFIVIYWVSPTVVMNKALSSGLTYLIILPEVGLSIDEESRGWSEGWSVIYLVWWIAWAPFVGPFIARISRGRSIRQFLLCVILVPTATSIVWFSAFAGGVFELPGTADVAAAVNKDYTLGLFAFFSASPWGDWLSICAILLLLTFVVTSADSAVYVMGMLTGHVSTSSKLVWSLVLVAIAAALVYQNNVDLNKQIAIMGAIPFTFVLFFQLVMFFRDLLATEIRPGK